MSSQAQEDHSMFSKFPIPQSAKHYEGLGDMVYNYVQWGDKFKFNRLAMMTREHLAFLFLSIMSLIEDVVAIVTLGLVTWDLRGYTLFHVLMRDDSDE